MQRQRHEHERDHADEFAGHREAHERLGRAQVRGRGRRVAGDEDATGKDDEAERGGQTGEEVEPSCEARLLLRGRDVVDRHVVTSHSYVPKLS